MPDPLAALLAYSGHELRTPLTSLTLATQMCADGTLGPLTSAQAETLAGAVADCSRLRHLIDLLADPVLAGDHGRLARTPIDAPAVLAAAVAMVQELAAERGVRLVDAPQPPPPSIHADPVRLARAIEQTIAHALLGARRGSAVAAQAAVAGFAIAWQPEADASLRTMPLWIAERLVTAMGGRVEAAADRIAITFG